MCVGKQRGRHFATNFLSSWARKWALRLGSAGSTMAPPCQVPIVLRVVPAKRHRCIVGAVGGERSVHHAPRLVPSMVTGSSGLHVGVICFSERSSVLKASDPTLRTCVAPNVHRRNLVGKRKVRLFNSTKGGRVP